MGDRTRRLYGYPNAWLNSVSTTIPSTLPGSALIYEGGYLACGYSTEKKYYVAGLTLDSERTLPTGVANIPRSWGSLACAYLGQPVTP